MYATDEGLAKGREEGLAKGKLEIASNALAEGLAPEIVQKITGLSMEAIKGLTK